MTTVSNIDINSIYDKPYSELTNEEIEALIEYKAMIRARDQVFAEQTQAINDAGDRWVAACEAEAKKAWENQKAFYELSMQRLQQSIAQNGGAANE